MCRVLVPGSSRFDWIFNTDTCQHFNTHSKCLYQVRIAGVNFLFSLSGVTQFSPPAPTSICNRIKFQRSLSLVIHQWEFIADITFSPAMSYFGHLLVRILLPCIGWFCRYRIFRRKIQIRDQFEGKKEIRSWGWAVPSIDQLGLATSFLLCS